MLLTIILNCISHLSFPPKDIYSRFNVHKRYIFNVTGSGLSIVVKIKKSVHKKTRAIGILTYVSDPRFVQPSSCRICPLPLLPAPRTSCRFPFVRLTMIGPKCLLRMCTWVPRILTTRWLD